MKIVLVGAGRLATQLGLSLVEAGHQVTAVYSRTMASASALAAQVGAEATDRPARLPLQADAFIIAVKDAAIAPLLPSLTEGRTGQVFFHTAGSVPMSVFESSGLCHYGVFYPMQTFSPGRRVSFSNIPVFIEASDEPTLALARRLALSVSRRVSELSSADRRHLHLAAVFACNFVNHCYALSAEVLEGCGLPFDVMLPLIDETARKVHSLHPLDAQTGPAVRFDGEVIQAQSQLLASRPQLRQVYDTLSRSIHESATRHEASS
ncbi:MAG: DUF2520 domain-containing protein [Prevotella sp.]|nr:DUF2520 domain-containing protein [Prevotella sp.]